MNEAFLESVIRTMRKQGADIAPGLSSRQIRNAENALGFCFPPDLRLFLEYALPVGKRFPDWRVPTSEDISGRLNWPADGVCFDIEHDNFWLVEWGAKPSSLEQAKLVARQAIQEAPPLIPIYAHRYLPAVPCDSGNPVFSVYQTDIINYGNDLPSYFGNELSIPNPYPVPESPREIQFWSELKRLNG